MNTLHAYRFAAYQLSTKPGPKGRTLTYVDVRVLAAVLDDLAPGWSSAITLTHNGSEYAAVCQLTADGITRTLDLARITDLDFEDAPHIQIVGSSSLDNYLQASRLLLDCSKVAFVSNRGEIQETLLLPPQQNKSK